MMNKNAIGLVAVLLLTACNQEVAPSKVDKTAQAPLREIPAQFAPFGDGYPKAGSPCRKLGESDATRNWLDDSATLVGCLNAQDAKALGGKIVDTKDGVTLVSVPE